MTTQGFKTHRFLGLKQAEKCNSQGCTYYKDSFTAPYKLNITNSQHFTLVLLSVWSICLSPLLRLIELSHSVYLL